MRWIFCLLVCVSLSADPVLRLGERMEGAQSGDYLVTFQNRSCTLLLVREAGDERILFEEVTLPMRGAQALQWRTWLEQGAPGHSSWIVYAIDRKTSGTVSTYSYSRRGWLDPAQSGQFFSTLLNTRFSPVPDGRRRRVGALGVRAAQRAIWNPPLVFEGDRHRDVPFDAWEATWPTDGSALAGRHLTIYLPHSEGDFPGYFPYWLEVSPALLESKLRVVDSGRGLFSPQTLPDELRCD